METILIAGGTGLIGKSLVDLWKKSGINVRILTRGKTNEADNLYHWNPVKSEFDSRALEGVSIIVNLSGAGIADKRWTKERKEELMNSRVDTTFFLFENTKDCPSLKQYISASGIICYGFDQPERAHPETDNFGCDYLSEITNKWEAAASVFSSICTVSILRISVVLSKDGGALGPISKPIRYGFGTILGNGKQGVPWVHISDLTQQFEHLRKNNLPGIFNTNAGNTTNGELTRKLAKVLKKPLWLPNAPAFMLKLILGEMSTVVLDGSKADNSKLKNTGFTFEFSDLETCLKSIYSA